MLLSLYVFENNKTDKSDHSIDHFLQGFSDNAVFHTTNGARTKNVPKSKMIKKWQKVITF
jgi:hypothetical protein